MRIIFCKCVGYYSFNDEEVNKQELRAWTVPIVGKFIKEKLGITVGHLKTERRDEFYNAYYDCVLHRKAQYMTKFDDNFFQSDGLKIAVLMRQNGVLCQCLLSDKSCRNKDVIFEEHKVIKENSNEIPNFEALKELEILFNRKREEIIQDENVMKEVGDEIQKIADQIINL